MHYRRLTEQEEKAVKCYLAEGFSRRSIANRFGVGMGAIDRIANPEAYERRRVRDNARERELRSEFSSYRVDHHSGNVDADASKLMAEVPVDSRTPQQVLMGEPQWERSALYRKQIGGEA